jgi:hypothetical protein
MKTINLNDLLSVEKIDLNEQPKFKLTEGVIRQLNYLQTGGALHENPIFDNSGINDILDTITQIHDFILNTYMYRDINEMDPNEVLIHLAKAMELKDHFNSLKAPVPRIN